MVFLNVIAVPYMLYKLISAYKSPEEIAFEIGATSVAFNSLPDFLDATNEVLKWVKLNL